MKAVLLILISLLLNTSSNVVCSCGITLDEEGARRLKDKMDIIIEGTAIEVVDEQFNKYCTNENVRVRVDRVINGPDNLKEIITNQTSAGNCIKSLTIGEQYIIIGNKLAVKQSKLNSTKAHIPLEIKNSIKNGINLCRKKSDDEEKYWNCLYNVNTVIITDGCLIVDSKLKFFNYF